MNRYLACQLRAVFCAVALLSNGFGQQPTIKPKKEVRGVHQVVSRVPGEMLAQLNDSLQQLASKVSPAVVQIEVTGFGSVSSADRKELALVVRQHAVGAGVIVAPDGYIMTNAHVVEGAQRIRVILWVPPVTLDDVSNSGNVQTFNAKIIGLQRETDLALLKIEANNLPALPLRLDRSPQPGEIVFAIGSPDGLQNSVSMGVISSAWRQPDPDNPMVYLQTDAPINPGSSGGPLVDVTGAVVGLNTFILSSGRGNEGLGFAIPARIVDFVYQGLRKYGHVYRIEIGTIAQTITPAIAQGLGLAQNWGVVIADVIPYGPADVAGLRPGDVVVAVDGRPMLTLTTFTAALYQHPPDQVLKVDVQRGAQRLSFNVPGIMPRDRMDQLADVSDPIKSHIEALGILGLDLNDELSSLLPAMRRSTGVLVIGQAPGFGSVDTGLRIGDVIHSMNRATVESVDQLKTAVAQIKPGDAVVLQIERRGQFQYLAFEME